MSGEFWTGGLNEGFALDAEVGFYDTTLRDGEQTVGVVLSPDDKLELARGLDELGVERIEAGFPRVSEDDRRAVELVSGARLNAEIWGFSRAVPADVEALVELGIEASVIESPISDLKLEALRVSREKMLERITDAIANAVEHGIHVAFFGVDSTRATPDYYAEVYRAAVEAGAREVVAAERRIVLGKKSGLDSIRIKAAELGLELSEEAQREVLAAVKRRGAEKRGLVTDDEFRELVERGGEQ